MVKLLRRTINLFKKCKMAKINNTAAYAISNTIDGSDIVIGSENGDGGDTKNFQMSDISTFVLGNAVTPTLDDVCQQGASTTAGITVAGTTTLNGTVDINNTADISGNTTVGGTLGVTGASTFEDTVTFTDSNSISASGLISTAGNIFAIGTVAASFLATDSSGAPASASATGTTGSIVADANYIYVCTATDTWKRVAIATW
jgi:hypothetical protein